MENNELGNTEKKYISERDEFFDSIGINIRDKDTRGREPYTFRDGTKLADIEIGYFDRSLPLSEQSKYAKAVDLLYEGSTGRVLPKFSDLNSFLKSNHFKTGIPGVEKALREVSEKLAEQEKKYIAERDNFFWSKLRINTQDNGTRGFYSEEQGSYTFKDGTKLADIKIEVTDPTHPLDEPKRLVKAVDLLYEGYQRGSESQYFDGLNSFVTSDNFNKDIPGVEEALGAVRDKICYENSIARHNEGVAQVSAQKQVAGKGYVLPEPHNPVTGERFQGENAKKAMYLMGRRNSTDPRFLEFTDILKAGLTLKDEANKEALVISSNGKSRFFYNAVDIDGMPPRTNSPVQQAPRIQRSAQKNEKYAEMGL